MKDTNYHKEDGICFSCRRCRVKKNISGKITIHCREFGPIRSPVYECSEHHPKTMPYKHEMEDMATIIEFRGNIIGFIKPGTKEHDDFRNNNDLHWDDF